MKKIFFTASMLLSIAAYSQVGINTQTPKGTLDVTAKKTDGTTAEGLIAPRLTGDQIKAADAQYGTDQKGTIVYATAAVGTSSTKTANITSEGYYYFDGSLWQKISSATAASGWGLTGNSGTTASTSAIGTDVNNNFIGTTDAQDLVLASNNKETVRVTSNQQVGINTVNPQGVFNIDGGKDNPATGVLTPAQQANDFVVTPTGSVGIGVTAPTNTLEVNSGITNQSGIKMTQFPSISVLATDSNGNIISGNSSSAGSGITKLRLTPVSTNLVLNSASGIYSFRYNSTLTMWQIKLNTTTARSFNIWDMEIIGLNTTGNVYQARTVKTIQPNVWTNLDANNVGGTNEVAFYHVYDMTSGVILRFTATLVALPAVNESMILEEF